MTPAIEQLLTLLNGFGEACFKDGQACTLQEINAALAHKKTAYSALLYHLRTMPAEDLKTL